ncbi:hypothetical protein ROZALSC1DRAFT_12449 [Rozella allomycis CSF55]|uniref:Ribosomal RNA-processing protein 43 n=1 Tax=Rozella allomycis (strain CSF55) TaxID=988480 RepID=A0A4P9YMA3_ROZAC|nr:hypothetical protein ROZALSC1DRAFT_12449 [Rozella allomycis CSF55]
MAKLTFEAQVYKQIYPREFLSRFLQNGLRPDGRKVDQQRPLETAVDCISTADGSCLLKLGKTSVLCGVKAHVTQPSLAHANKGYIVPNVDLNPMCSPSYRPGPPPDVAQVMSEQLNRLFESGEIVDLNELCIIAGKLVWVLHVDVTVLCDDGNVFDAALMAIQLALQKTKLPRVHLDEEEMIVSVQEDEKPLFVTMKQLAIPVTVGFFQNQILFDLSKDEELNCDGTMTVVVNPTKNIMSVWKGGSIAVPLESIQTVIQKSYDSHFAKAFYNGA